MADSSNIGRNFLLIGIVLGVGAVAAGVYVLNSSAPISLAEDIAQFTDEHRSKSNASESDSPASKEQGNHSDSSELTQEPAQMKQDALSPRRMVDVAPPLEEAFIPRDKAPGQKVPRYTPLFFAPAIWQVPDAQQKKNVAVDLLEPGSHPLHSIAPSKGETKPKPVPNSWFYLYGIEKSLCMADAMQQDPDEDGFSNAEEFVAKTDPSNAESMPPFVADDAVKLVSTGEKKVSTHFIELSSASYFDEQKVTINIFSENEQRIMQHKELGPGMTFGFGDGNKGPLAKDRFTLEKIDQKSGETGMPVNFVLIKDSYTQLSDAKEFSLMAGSRNRRMVRDISLKLRVTAGPKKGTELVVQPGQKFDVPGFKDTQCVMTDAGKKKTLPKVKVNDGAEISVQIDSATTPAKSEE